MQAQPALGKRAAQAAAAAAGARDWEACAGAVQLAALLGQPGKRPIPCITSIVHAAICLGLGLTGTMDQRSAEQGGRTEAAGRCGRQSSHACGSMRGGLQQCAGPQPGAGLSAHDSHPVVPLHDQGICSALSNLLYNLTFLHRVSVLDP
jgi:hypothetical protein